MASFSSSSTFRVVGRTMGGATRPDRAASAPHLDLTKMGGGNARLGKYSDACLLLAPGHHQKSGARPRRSYLGGCSPAYRGAVLRQRFDAPAHPLQVVYVFRRSRLTFASVRLTNGANSAAWPRPLMSAAIDIWTAAAFSAVMRRYSAGVQVPWAIIRLRRKTVSQDAIVRRAIIIGRAKDEFRAGFLMSWR